MQRHTLILSSLALFAVAIACRRESTSAAPAEASASTVAPKQAPALPQVALDHPGCFAIVALDDGDEPRLHEGAAGECEVPTFPASTFKIPHALVALQTGVITDPDALERWDGTKQWLPAWERDHSLRTAIFESVLWFFQRTAVKIGAERMREQLAKIDYGNAQVDGEIRKFWLAGGSLEITPTEQLDFVERMFEGKLPIEPAHVATVVSIMQSDLARWKPRVPEGFAMPASSATFWAKTGTDAEGDRRVTWWMGAIEGPRGRFAFVSRVRDVGEPSAISPAVEQGIRALDALDVL
jgi:beta-lactamase class D